MLKSGVVGGELALLDRLTGHESSVFRTVTSSSIHYHGSTLYHAQ